jgi:hypothetical protein
MLRTCHELRISLHQVQQLRAAAVAATHATATYAVWCALATTIRFNGAHHTWLQPQLLSLHTCCCCLTTTIAAIYYCCYFTQLMELLKNNDSIRDERERARKVCS